MKTIPEDITQLKTIFQEQNFSAVYFKNDIDKAYYLTGYGTREQFAKLYKTIYQFPEFDIRYKLKDLAAYLNIQQILLVKMIQVFEELGFVTIKDGVMTVNKRGTKAGDRRKSDLPKSQTNRQRPRNDGAGYRARNVWFLME